MDARKRQEQKTSGNGRRKKPRPPVQQTLHLPMIQTVGLSRPHARNRGDISPACPIPETRLPPLPAQRVHTGPVNRCAVTTLPPILAPEIDVRARTPRPPATPFKRLGSAQARRQGRPAIQKPLMLSFPGPPTPPKSTTPTSRTVTSARVRGGLSDIQPHDHRIKSASVSRPSPRPPHPQLRQGLSSEGAILHVHSINRLAPTGRVCTRNSSSGRLAPPRQERLNRGMISIESEPVENPDTEYPSDFEEEGPNEGDAAAGVASTSPWSQPPSTIPEELDDHEDVIRVGSRASVDQSIDESIEEQLESEEDEEIEEEIEGNGDDEDEDEVEEEIEEVMSSSSRL